MVLRTPFAALLPLLFLGTSISGLHFPPGHGIANSTSVERELDTLAFERGLDTPEELLTLRQTHTPKAEDAPQARANSLQGPFATGAGGWEWAYEKASSVVKQMTIEERVNLTTGIGSQGRCEGNTGSVLRFDIPELCFQDGPAGLRTTDGATVFPAGITMAATWDRDLWYRRGKALGAEARAKGINVHLGPVTGGPLGRSPYQGRNWEGPGPDPYLHGENAYYTVAGNQDAGVIATAKHYLAYEQETWRQLNSAADPWRFSTYNNTKTYDALVDDRAIHELYLWPFAQAVRAGAAAVMCVYNRINGTQGCQSSHVLNTLLKEELDFQGFVVSDWGATYSNATSANNGLDVVMPGGFFGSALIGSVKNGTVSEARLDDMATRVLMAWYLQGQDQNYPVVSYKDGTLVDTINGTTVNEHLNVQEDHRKIAYESAQAAVTLLKNNRTRSARRGKSSGLPLQDPFLLGVFGSDAGPNPYGLNSCDGWLGAGSQFCLGNTTSNGTNAIGWGSGAGLFPHLIDPLAALQERTRKAGTTLESSLMDKDDGSGRVYGWIASTAQRADASLVFVQARSGENLDRASLTLEANGDELIKHVASNCNNTIVVMHTVGQVLMDEWWDHENITAVVQAHLPGQESGAALVPVLYGNVSPSGKMPYSVLAAADAWHYPNITTEQVEDPKVDFKEGIFVDYRGHDNEGLQPLVPFGHGFSYTTFKYENLQMASLADSGKHAPTRTPVKKSSKNAPGGKPELYDYLLSVTADVKNVGSVTGTEVAQLYVKFPKSVGAPPKQLRGFDKLKDIGNGESQTATFSLTRKDMSSWSVERQEWYIADGVYHIYVGKSSRDLDLKQKVTMKGGAPSW